MSFFLVRFKIRVLFCPLCMTPSATDTLIIKRMVICSMAKKGMKRPEWTHTQPRNEQEPVPEIQGKAKHTKEKAKPVTEP